MDISIKVFQPNFDLTNIKAKNILVIHIISKGESFTIF
jgi:hypothetical protein